MARHNPRLAKINRPYTTEQISDLFGVHKKTVLNWIKDGLLVAVKKRPMLIMGADIREYLVNKQKRQRRPCGPGQIYCVACKKPQNPQGGLAELSHVNNLVGDLTGTCPGCSRRIYRKVSLAKEATWIGNLKLTKLKG